MRILKWILFSLFLLATIFCFFIVYEFYTNLSFVYYQYFHTTNNIMKQNIHPKYNEVKVTCSCGNSFMTRSTLGSSDLSIDVCSMCHPFYTGKQKIVDTAGQVDKF